MTSGDGSPDRISPGTGPEFDDDDFVDPELEAMEWSLEEGLIWLERMGWVTREDAETEVGAEMAQELYDQQQRDWAERKRM